MTVRLALLCCLTAFSVASWSSESGVTRYDANVVARRVGTLKCLDTWRYCIYHNTLPLRLTQDTYDDPSTSGFCSAKVAVLETYCRSRLLLDYQERCSFCDGCFAAINGYCDDVMYWLECLRYEDCDAMQKWLIFCAIHKMRNFVSIYTDAVPRFSDDSIIPGFQNRIDEVFNRLESTITLDELEGMRSADECGAILDRLGENRPTRSLIANACGDGRR